MPYPAINSRRLPYDIDGTAVGTGSSFLNGVTSFLTGTNLTNINKEDKSYSKLFGDGNSVCYWFFFPELKEITAISAMFSDYTSSSFSAQGSADSVNGMDGTWENAVCTSSFGLGADDWRNKIFTLSFSGPIKVLRISFYRGTAYLGYVRGIHLYGRKAAGQTPDDVIFCNSMGVEYTTLKDFGDTPEGTTYNDVFYLKNVSSKQANALNVQLNHADFLMSLDQANWTTVIDITSLSAGQISQPIYVRKTLGPPLLILGPRSARVILTIGSFT